MIVSYFIPNPRIEGCRVHRRKGKIFLGSTPPFVLQEESSKIPRGKNSKDLDVGLGDGRLFAT
jgi:hypothetical protein